MLFLPGGDKVEGLREMLRARDRGELLRGEADFQLHVIYLWYEQNYEEALRLLDGLRARYPHNPLFVQSIAEVQNVYRHDHAASLDAWRALFDLARQRRVALPEMSEARARLGIGDGARRAVRDRLRDRAAAHRSTDAKPSAPYGIAALAHYRLGAAYDRMGARAQAVTAYQAALAARRRPTTRTRCAAKARDGLRRAPDARAAEAYRLSIEGLRHLQRARTGAGGRHAGAGRRRSRPPIPSRSTARRGCCSRGGVTRTRSPRSNGSSPCAPSRRRRSSPRRATTPRACSKQAGQRERAIEMYRRASRVRGAEAAVRDASMKALERLPRSGLRAVTTSTNHGAHGAAGRTEERRRPAACPRV